MNILVTGGSGFIGSHIVDKYIQLGHRVAVVDDLSSGKRANLNPEAVFYEVAIQSSELGSVFSEFRPDFVNHHAAHIDLRRSVIEPAHDAQVNVMGSLNLLNLSRKHSVKKMIFASTGGAIYGEPSGLPVSETADPKPLSPYGANKLVVEHYLRIWKLLHGIDFTIFRYPNVYGPRQDPTGEAGVVAIFSLKFINGQIPVIFGDGAKTRDYLYVDDIVSANVLALTQGSGEVLNLGWGIEVTDLEVFNHVRRAVESVTEPAFDRVRPGEVLRIALNSDRAQTLLNWKPKVPFEIGTKLAVDFYVKSVEKF